ncbi:hypothetical protein CFP56_040799 [Quercus suber]|uniref:DUF7903 domain-containing protein n=1 Tax=Quercus suber TaxID=58331 RepID=A0AAW0LLH2_QUESU
MAYIPPHKRHSYEAAGSSIRHNRPSPIPQSLVPQFRRNLNLRRLPPKPFSQRSGKIVYKYAEQAISTWFPVGLDHNPQFPSSVHVDSVPFQLFERTTGTSPLVLFNNNNHPASESPWVYIAENVVSDLLSSLENVKNETLDLEDVKPKLVLMAYIPPHKRHSYKAVGSSDRHNRPSPIPQSLVPQFRTNLHLRRLPPKPFSQRSGKIVYKYAEQAISTWFPVGLDHNHPFPSSVHVDSVPFQLFERTTGTSPLVLFNNNNHPASESPWVYIAENVVSDLLSSFKNVKNETLDLEDVKPKLVARFRKILFHESPSISEETTRVGLAAETTFSHLRRSFYTNIPNSYMENIKGEVAQKIKVDFEEEKDLYHVKAFLLLNTSAYIYSQLCLLIWLATDFPNLLSHFLFGATLPDSTISCTCSVIKEDKRLQLYKASFLLNIDAHCIQIMLRSELVTWGADALFSSCFSNFMRQIHQFNVKSIE